MEESGYMKIALVSDFFYPRLGGVENHIRSLALELTKIGHKVIVITHAYGNRRGVRYMEGPIKVYYCPIRPMVDQDALPTFTATLPLIRWILVRENIQIVHGHQATSTMANEAIVYASAMGLKTVYTDHSLFALDDLAGIILNRVQQATLSTVDHAICVSNVCRHNLLLRTRLRASCTVIPNAVHHLEPASQRQTPADRICIVVLSRLVYRKGVDLLVGIIPQICLHIPNVDFLIGGDGSQRLALQEMVEQNRLEDRVTFLGAIPHTQVRDVLVQGDIFLNCSLTESFCIAILEAASAGLRVVSTNVGGVPEVLPDDMIMLADPNVSSMVEALIRAIQEFKPVLSSSDHDQQHQAHKDKSERIAAWERHERIKCMYSWERVAHETVQVYQRVLLLPTKTLHERLNSYLSLGGLAGWITCFLALGIDLILQLICWAQPIESIDVVPDLVAFKCEKIHSE